MKKKKFADGGPSYENNIRDGGTSFIDEFEKSRAKVKTERYTKPDKENPIKITPELVRLIRKEDDTTSNIAKKYKASITTVYNIRNRLSWKNVKDD